MTLMYHVITTVKWRPCREHTIVYYCIVLTIWFGRYDNLYENQQINHTVKKRKKESLIYLKPPCWQHTSKGKKVDTLRTTRVVIFNVENLEINV